MALGERKPVSCPEESFIAKSSLYFFVISVLSTIKTDFKALIVFAAPFGLSESMLSIIELSCC